jgi:predicted nucleic acid-binding protein
LLADEPAAEEVERLLRLDEPMAVTAVNLAEAIDVAVRVHGIPFAEMQLVLDPLLRSAVVVVPVSLAHAWLAAALRARHYDRRSRAVSLADCFLLAAALERADASVATSDPSLAEAARREGVQVTALPDRDGRVP